MPTLPFAPGDFSTDPFGPPLQPRAASTAAAPAAPVPTAVAAPAAARPTTTPAPARSVTAAPARNSAPAPAARPQPVIAAGPRIVAATDGSALGNPGFAGACWYVDETHWASAGVPRATNNAMELLAVRDLLAATAAGGQAGAELEIQADSQYVIKAVAGWEGKPAWVHGWRRKNWVTASGSPVANRELLEEIAFLLRGRTVIWTWVRGHNGHALNEAADVRARAAATAAGQAGAPVGDGPGWPDGR